jgi:RNA ligase (TIGR02306 family)
MSERKLATIRTISEIRPIEGADNIELATVNGWKVVVGKEVGHKVGNPVVYCEVDSFLPIRPEFEFLRKSSYRKMGDVEGFNLKTIKLRGQLSQGLILPMDVFVDYGYRVSDDLLKNKFNTFICLIEGIPVYSSTTTSTASIPAINASSKV